MSSPASAEASLLRAGRPAEQELEQDDEFYAGQVYDSLEQELTIDLPPGRVVEDGEVTMSESDRRRLRSFAKSACELKGDADFKVKKAAEKVAEMLREGYQPIVFCRYIATADYVAEQLKTRLADAFPDLHAIAVTGEIPDEEREIRIKELVKSDCRVLVATDCLSEGIDLQDGFNAVLHYDLPWNPNRLEQREGRVDRFGQNRNEVKAVLLYGRDNPIDGAVLDVLLRKAKQIHRTLGISLPIPMESESVMEAVLKALFLKGRMERQLQLFGEEISVDDIHRMYDRAAEREKESRTRFAQHAIKPDEVKGELEETAYVLGDSRAVEGFVRAACGRLGSPLRSVKGGWRLNTSALPSRIKELLDGEGDLKISFDAAPLTGFKYVGRNHVLTESLAEHLIDQALGAPGGEICASRCGVLRTSAVQVRTTLLLLRLRFLMKSRGQDTPVLAEECVLTGFRGRPGSFEWLQDAQVVQLFLCSQPERNVTQPEKESIIADTLEWLPPLEAKIKEFATSRAKRLEDAHRRVRRITREGMVTVQPKLPADILGIYVALPIPKGVAV